MRPLDGKDLGQDVRFAVRAAFRRPAHSFAVVLTLALGIGATAAVFGVVRAVLLRPLPYAAAESLVLVKELPAAAVPAQRAPNPTAAAYAVLQDATDVFASATAFSAEGLNLTGGAYPEWVLTAAVSAEALETLGLPVQRGRGFAADETAAVILTDGLWRRAFGASEDVVGNTVQVDGEAHTVVGVLPAGVGFLDGVMRGRFDMLRVTDHIRPAPAMGTGTMDPRVFVVARLAEGVTHARAAERMRGLATAVPPDPGTGETVAFQLVPLRAYIVGSADQALWLLMSAAVLVLLIAGVNVVNLRLSQAGSREKEIAVRCALGAGWQRLGRLFSVEASVLAAAGAAGGLALAHGLTVALQRLSPRSLPRLDELGLDWSAVAAVALLALVVTVLLGLLPLARWRRVDLQTSLRVGPGERRVAAALAGRVFVVVQVAASVALLAGTALITRSFVHMYTQDLGYDSGRVLNVFMALDAQRYPDGDGQRAFLRELTEQLEARPGVARVAAVNYPLGEGAGMQGRVYAGSAAGSAEEGHAVVQRMVSPGFFATSGIPVLRGRDFKFERSASGGVQYVVSRDLAEAVWPSEDAIGRTLTPRGQEAGTVIGVAEDVRFSLTAGRTEPTVYTSYVETPSRYFNLMVRTETEPLGLFPVVREVVAGMDARQSVHLPPTMETLDRRLAGSVADRWMVFLFVGGFSTVALVLSSLGLYGLLAGRVREQLREIGVRLAIGASPGRIYRGVLREGLILTLTGLGIGVAAGLVLTRSLERYLFQVTSTDPVTFLAAAAFLLVVATLASLLPARRAARVDPLVSLRQE